jgi:hypothetical protein
MRDTATCRSVFLGLSVIQYLADNSVGNSTSYSFTLSSIVVRCGLIDVMLVVIRLTGF